MTATTAPSAAADRSENLPVAVTQPAPPVAVLLRVLRVLTLAGLGVYIVLSVGAAYDNGSEGSLPQWLFSGLLLITSIRCLVRGVLIRAQRPGWLIVGLGLLSWAFGEILFAASSSSGGQGSLSLSVADLASLAFYPAAYATLLVLLGAAVDRFSPVLWLDGMAGALAVSALIAAFAFPSVLAGGGDITRVIGNMSYPLADLLLITVVLFTLAMTGWRPGKLLGLMTSALVLIAMADAFGLWWSSTGHSSTSTVVDWLWPAGAALIAEAAWQSPLIKQSGIPASGIRSLVIPAVFSISAIGLLISGLLSSLNSAGYELGIAALAILVARMTLTAIDNMGMAARSQREAMTDALTGLRNRRSLMVDLEAAVAKGSMTSPAVLMLFDLDGFKRYNDTFGHPAGDALLARMGQALEQAVGKDARPYRLGGDEFCVLLTGSSRQITDVVPGIVEALSDHGRGFSVAPSYGSVLIPHEAVDVTLALQLADQRLYERKGSRRRVSENLQTRDVLMQALRERQPDLSKHLSGVGALAHAVATRLGATAEEIDHVTRGAELHDIGKMAVPDGILQKPSGLDELERSLMNQHTVIGERILAAAPALRPVAELVRGSHERWDGTGYPDQLAGEEIPQGARIIAVCDAFDAMTSGRPYQPAVSLEDALAELRRCAGTQFDPRVVETFCHEAPAHYSPPPAAEPAPLVSRMTPNGAPAIERR